MKLSIIIPVYNVEPYLAKCIGSVLGQKGVSASDFEVIFVNDGSTDGSLQLLKDCLERNGDNFNIRLIDQENKGLSEARNAGLSKAQGEYVWFIDSDDWISAESFSMIFKAIDEHNPDLVYFKRAHSNGSEIVRTFGDFGVDKVISGLDFLNRHYNEPCAPFYAVRRSILNDNGLRFYPGIFHEDNEFTPRLLYFVKSAVILDETLYYIYLRPDSIGRSVNYKKPYDYVKVAVSLWQFRKTHYMDRETGRTFCELITIVINRGLMGTEGMDKEALCRYNAHLGEHGFIHKAMCGSNRLKYIFESLLIRLTGNYIKVFRLLEQFKKAC